MSRLFAEFTGQFFWDFKRMDNVNYNFEIVEFLYAAKKANNNSCHFNKPIIILIAGILECSLYDFTIRIKQRRHDPLPNLAQSVISYFNRINETDEFNSLISRASSQNLLMASATDTIYQDLDFLRKMRNRIHIQNKHNLLDRDEDRIFKDNNNLIIAQNCLERVIGVLCNGYPRWGSIPIPMSDFPRPWL